MLWYLSGAHRTVLAHLLGYLFALWVGNLVVTKIVDQMSKMMPKCARSSCPPQAFGWKARPLGWVETALYMTSFLAGQFSAVTVWLTFKTVGRWQTLKGSNQRWYETYPREKAFEVYVIGNGLSIINAAVGWQIVRLSQSSNGAGVLTLMVATCLGGWSLVCWLRGRHVDMNRDLEKMGCLSSLDAPCPLLNEMEQRKGGRCFSAKPENSRPGKMGDR